MSLPQKTAADFGLKVHNYGRMTGVSVAIHAVPDAFLVLHTGVGCKYKGSNQLMLHDLARPALHHEGYTEVSDRVFVKGSASRIGPYVLNWHGKRRPAYMAVVASTFLEMAGEDIAGAVERSAATVPAAVDYIRTLGFDGDLFDGYAAVLAKLLARAPFKATKAVKSAVSAAGFFFHRHEPDVIADAAELDGLISSLGFEPGPGLLGGRPFSELMRSAASGSFVCLPYLGKAGEAILRKSGRAIVHAGLPIGLSGTEAWLRRVGAGLGARPSVVESAVKNGRGGALDALKSLRERARKRLGNRRSVVFADTPLAAGLAAFATEAGLPPVLVGLRDESLGGREAFLRLLAEAGPERPKDLEVLCNPPLADARRRIASLAADGTLGLLFASTYEAAEPARAGVRVPVIETGFPCVGWHAGEPSPTLGYAGVKRLCRRILEQI